MATNFNWEEDELPKVQAQNQANVVTNFNWEEDEVQPAATVESKSPWQKFEDFAKPSKETIQERRDTAKGYAGEIGAGLVRASAGLEWLGAAAVETVYDAGRIIGREGYKAVTDTPEYEMDQWKQTDYLTSNIKKAEKELTDKLLPEDRDSAGRVMGRIAEYAAPTAGMTRLFINQGKKIAANPKLLANSGLKRKFQESMVAASKSPKAAQSFEQGISAVMATVGQTAEELGVSKGWQVPIELVTGILTGTVANRASSIGGWIEKNSPSSLRQLGKNKAAEYLQSIEKSDPEFMVKLQRGLDLQEKTGVKMNVAQLTDNPELRMAVKELELLEAGGSTRLQSALAGQVKKIKEIAPRDTPAQEAGMEALETERAITVSNLEQQATKAIDDVVDQVDKVAPLDKVTMGETGQTMLTSAREASDAKINMLYSQVGNPTLQIDEIVKSVKQAKSSPLKDDAYMREFDAEIKQLLEANILDKGKKRGMSELMTGKIKPPEMSLSGIRSIESRIKEKIRIANAAGESNKARLLGKVLNGIFNQYKKTTGLSSLETSNLRKAAEASKKQHDIFNQGENLLTSKVDVQGMDKVTSEGFVRVYIKANSDSSVARTEEAIDNFYNAYGNMPEAKAWMTNSFGSLLKESFPDIANANPKQVQSFIAKHSRFLKKAGIDDKFSNVRKAVEEARIADSAKKLDSSEFMSSALGKFLNSDDPVKMIANAVGTKSFNKIISSANNIKNKSRREYILRGIRESVWDGTLSKMSTAERISGEQMLSTGNLRKALDNPEYAKSLEQALGKEHTKNLSSMMDVIDRISLDVSQTAGLPTTHVDENLVEKLMTGLRAAAHGFVRPDLIAVQMGMRGMKAITVKESHKILKEALNNPDFAKELLKLNTTKEGKIALKTMFTPLASSAIEKTSDE